MRAIYPAFRVLFPNQVIRADDLARAMVDVAVRGTMEQESLIFENRDIPAMVARLVRNESTKQVRVITRAENGPSFRQDFRHVHRSS